MNEQRDARTGEHPHMTSLIDLPSRRGAHWGAGLLAATLILSGALTSAPGAAVATSAAIGLATSRVSRPVAVPSPAAGRVPGAVGSGSLSSRPGRAGVPPVPGSTPGRSRALSARTHPLRLPAPSHPAPLSPAMALPRLRMPAIQPLSRLAPAAPAPVATLKPGVLAAAAVAPAM